MRVDVELLPVCIRSLARGFLFLSELVNRAPGQAELDWLVGGLRKRDGRQKG